MPCLDDMKVTYMTSRLSLCYSKANLYYYCWIRCDTGRKRVWNNL